MLKIPTKPLILCIAIFYGLLFIFAYPNFSEAYLILSIVPLVLLVWFIKVSYGYVFFFIYLLVSLIYHIYNLQPDQPFITLHYITGNSIIFLILYGLNYFKQKLFYSKKSEENLLHFNIRKEEMIINISDVIAIIDRNGIIKYKSENVYHHFGWNAKDLIGKPGWDTVYPGDLDKVQNVFYQILKEDKSTTNFEFRYLCKDKSIKHIRLTAKNLINNPNIGGVLLNYHDISEVKKAQADLINSEYKYRTLFANSVDAVCILDNDKNVIELNDACSRLFEYPKEEMLNRNVSDFIHPDDKKNSDKYFNKLKNKGYYSMYEGRILTKTKKEKWIEVNSTLYEKEGQVIGSQDIIRDITNYKITQDKLKESNTAKDKLLSIISHDLRNPFGTIVGFAELISSKIKTKDYQNIEEFVSIIGETAEQGEKLLSNLLEWSKSQSGNMQFNPQPIILNDLCNDVFELMRFASKQKNIELVFDITESIKIVADKHMISTILRNLISNSIKFSNPDSEIYVKIRSHINHVTVSVIDYGVGLDKETQENLFDISKNISTIGTNDEKGTGFGLWICKDFIEKHQGEIWVESELHKGSQFHFSLPYDIL